MCYRGIYRELAAELADILREDDKKMTPPKPAISNPSLLGPLKSSREATASKSQTPSVSTHAKDVSRLLNVALPSSRDGKDTNHGKRERKPLQDQRKSNTGGDVHSRLGKRQHDADSSNQFSGNTVDARAAKFRHIDNETNGAPNPLREQMKYMEEMNRVAIQSGFRNAKEMLEMTSAVQPPHVPPQSTYQHAGQYHTVGPLPPHAPERAFPPNDFYGGAAGGYYPQHPGHFPPGHFPPGHFHTGFDQVYGYQGRGGRGGRGYNPRGAPTDGASFGRGNGRFSGAGRGGHGGETSAEGSKPTVEEEATPEAAPTEAATVDPAANGEAAVKPFPGGRGGGRGMGGRFAGRFAGRESTGRGGRDAFGRGGYVPRAVMNPFAQQAESSNDTSQDAQSAVGQIAGPNSHNPPTSTAAMGGEYNSSFAAPFRGGGRGYYGGRGPPRGYPAGGYHGPAGGVAPGRSANKVWVRPTDVATSLVSNR